MMEKYTDNTLVKILLLSATAFLLLSLSTEAMCSDKASSDSRRVYKDPMAREADLPPITLNVKTEIQYLFRMMETTETDGLFVGQELIELQRIYMRTIVARFYFPTLQLGMAELDMNLDQNFNFIKENLARFPIKEQSYYEHADHENSASRGKQSEVRPNYEHDL